MSPSATLLVQHGNLLLFGYVLISQLGAPLPSGPLILAIAALAASEHRQVTIPFLIVVLATLCADSVWYALGRARGGSVLSVLCRISLEPEVCVLRTRTAFRQYGGQFLLVAKFLPGLGLMAPPIAGQAKMPYERFVFFNGLGTLTWAGSYALVGYFLGEWVHRNAQLFHTVARYGVGALLTAIVAALAIRLVRRHRFRTSVAISRITPLELKRLMDLGEAVYIVDLRNPEFLGSDPDSLPGAIHLTPDQAMHRTNLIPKDRQVVLFCDCPGEASAALVAQTLQRGGFDRAQPLEGGFDGWKSAGYPVAPLVNSLPVEVKEQTAPVALR